MKRIAQVLTLVCTLLITSGCVVIEYPINLYIDEKFDVNEILTIIWALDEWNLAITARTGMESSAFRVVGTFNAEYDIGDATDPYRAIYKATEPTPAMRRMGENVPGGNLGGHATLSDMILLRYNYPDWTDAYWRYMLRAIVLHEFGHMLGITHFNHRYGIMNAAPDMEMYENPHITDADMDAYCHVHGCAE